MASSTDEKLREAAQKLEATFLSEMLKSAGFGAPRESFGGGIGEDQFSSFLRDEQARAMVEAGGIGLAESLFEAMKERMDA
ncbi:rod-binding protein [Yoonia sp. MH D7]